MPIKDNDIYSNLADSFIQTERSLASSLSPKRQATPFTDYQNEKEKPPEDDPKGAVRKAFEWARAGAINALPIDTAKKDQMFAEIWAREQGVTTPTTINKPHEVTIGPVSGKGGRNIGRSNQAQGSSQTPAEQFIGNFVMPATVPGGMIRQPIAWAGKALPKALTSSTAGKVTSKVLDTVVGKLGETKPPVIRGAEAVDRVTQESLANQGIRNAGDLLQPVPGFMKFGDDIDKNIANIDRLLAKPGRLPADEFTKADLQIQKARFQAQKFIKDQIDGGAPPSEVLRYVDDEIAEAGRGMSVNSVPNGFSRGKQANRTKQLRNTAVPGMNTKEMAAYQDELVSFRNQLAPKVTPIEMAPSTSVQPDMFGKPTQSKMLAESNTAIGQGGARQPLTLIPEKPLKGQQSLLQTTVTDVTPEGYGIENGGKTISPQLQRLKGETGDEARAREVGYQVDNGRVKLTEDRGGWKATFFNVGDEQPQVIRAIKKQDVLNQVWQKFNPDYIEPTVNSKAVPVSGKIVPKEGITQPKVITEEQYLASKGAGFMEGAEPGLHKNIQEGIAKQQAIKRVSQSMYDNNIQRDVLRNEYQNKVASGEIRPPTRIERLTATAKGHPDNQSTQSARILLEKQGIDWRNPQPLIETPPVVGQGIKTPPEPLTAPPVSAKPLPERILETLGTNSLTREELSKTLNVSGRDLSLTLTDMQQAGKIKLAANNKVKAGAINGIIPPVGAPIGAPRSIAQDMQGIYSQIESKISSYGNLIKGFKGEDAKSARLTMNLMNKELLTAQRIMQNTADKIKLSKMPVENLRQQIQTQVNFKGISQIEFNQIKKEAAGTNNLFTATQPQLQNVLEAVSTHRPVKIGNKTVVTPSTEKALQDLNTNLINQGKISSTTLQEVQHFLKLNSDRYISGRLFAGESEVKQLIKALNQEAETGLTEWKGKVNFAMLKSPSLKQAYEGIVSRLDNTKASYDITKPTGVSPFWDMSKYMHKLQERAGGKLGDLWKKAYDKYLENGVRLTNMDDELEASVPTFRQIANDPQALRRVNDYIASQNKWYLKNNVVEYPKDIKPDEILLAKKIGEQLSGFIPDVRYQRFYNAYNKFDGDLNMIAKEIPDAPLMDLNEAVKRYETNGAESLMEYLKTKKWGVIESGYEPHIVVNPKIQLHQIRSTVLSKGMLQGREGIQYEKGDLNILQRREKYIKRMLNLNLEPYIQGIARDFEQIKGRLDDPSRISREISNAMDELKGTYVPNTVTKFVSNLQGYAFSTLALSPHMSFRNSLQNLLHPDVMALVNPANQKLTKNAQRFFEAFVDQEKGVTKDYLMQGSMGNNKLSNFIQRISYYGKAETYLNRLPAFWGSLNKAERALVEYGKTGNADDFIKASGLNELTLPEQKHILETMSQDTVKYGVGGLQNISGKEAAVLEIARSITEKTHFNYIRAGRAPVEQGEIGRTLLSLSTYPRNIGTRIYEAGERIKNGSPAERIRAAKSVTSLIAGALLADVIYEKITGKTQDQYNPVQVLTYTPGGLAVGTVQDISALIGDVVDALSGDEAALSRIPSDITTLGDMFIPIYKSANDILDATTDNKSADKEAIRSIRKLFDDTYNQNPKSNDIEREWYQKIQKVLFGGGDQQGETLGSKYSTQWKDDFTVYNAIPTGTIEFKAAQQKNRALLSRDEYRTRNPQIDAKLFIAGEVSSLKSIQAVAYARNLITTNKIDPKQIKGIQATLNEQAKMKELGVRDTNITPVDRLVSLLSLTDKATASEVDTGYKIGGKNLSPDQLARYQEAYQKAPGLETSFDSWFNKYVLNGAK